MMWLFVCKSGPTDRHALRELVDMLMMAAVFGQPVQLLLMGDAACHLLSADASPLADLDGLLPGPCLVEAGAMGESFPAPLPVESASEDRVRALFHDCHRLVMF